MTIRPGSLLYQSAVGVTNFLAGNTAATDQVLVSHGTGSAAQAPTLTATPALGVSNMTGQFPNFSWITLPTLQNGWSDVGSTYGAAVYGKDAVGVVHVRGLITGGTSTDGTLLFTLPPGYRSPFTIGLPVVNATASETFAGVALASDGTVKLSGASGAAYIYINFSFVSF